MKHLIILGIVLFAGVFIINSCKENNTNSNTDTETITATINGNSWVSTKNYFNQEIGTFRKVVRIIGENNDEKIELVLQFFAFDTIKTKDYPLGPNGDNFAIYYHNNQSDTASIGTISISEYDYSEELGKLTIKGSFNCLINSNGNTYNIKNGYFYNP